MCVLVAAAVAILAIPVRTQKKNPPSERWTQQILAVEDDVNVQPALDWSGRPACRVRGGEDSRHDRF